MKDWLIANWALVVIFITLAGLFFKAGKWVEGINGLSTKVDDLATSINGFMTEIRSDIKNIFQMTSNSPIGSGSHLRLNDLGHEISTQLRAVEWATQKAQALIDTVRTMTPYQVQEYCSRYVMDLTFEDDEDFLTLIQACAFDRGLTESQVRSVLAVELRDILLGGREQPPQR